MIEPKNQDLDALLSFTDCFDERFYAVAGLCQQFHIQDSDDSLQFGSRLASD